MLNNVIPGAGNRLETTDMSRDHGFYSIFIAGEMCEGVPICSTSWSPTPEEMNFLLLGGTVIVSIIGQGHPAMRVNVQPPSFDDALAFSEGIYVGAKPRVRVLAQTREINDEEA